MFCQARNGDWDTAALTLGTARALGYVTDGEDALLSRFLDPDLYEGEDLPPLGGPMTPLTFRMLEAIGEPQPTGDLPRAFAQSDLRDTAGWKAQIEAAERLARAGAIDAARLTALYASVRAAASGGVWDRVAAVQALDAALEARDPARIGAALAPAWEAMAAADLEPVLAAMRGRPVCKASTLDRRRRGAGLPAGAADRRLRGRGAGPDPGRCRSRSFLQGIARGEPAGLTPPDQIAAAIADGFAEAGARRRGSSRWSTEGRTGEAILRAMDLVTLGATGELDELADGLALLRALGLDGTARRAALEILILDRRG